MRHDSFAYCLNRRALLLECWDLDFKMTVSLIQRLIFGISGWIFYTDV